MNVDESDLRQVLAERADDVHSKIDPVAEVHRRIVRARRRRTSALATACAAALVIAAAVTVDVRASAPRLSPADGPSPTDTMSDHLDMPTPAATASGPARAAVPQYLPAGATLVNAGVVSGPTNLHPAVSVSCQTWSLAGRANADTQSGAGQFDSHDLSIHPASVLELCQAAAGSGLSVPTDASSTSLTPVSVRGATATLVEPKIGVGRIAIQWTANGSDFLLTVTRLMTSDGLSGVDADVLTQVAASI